MTTIIHVKKMLKQSSRFRSSSFTWMVCQHLINPKIVDNVRKMQFGILGRTLFDFITDPVQTPDTLINLLDTYLPPCDWFNDFPAFKNVVAFFCLRALAKRKPVFEGAWEKLLHIIIKHSEGIENDETERKSKANHSDVIWLKWVQNLCSREKCPNPCLRLELIRLHTHYVQFFGEYDYEVSMRESIINTLCDIHDMHSSLTLDQISMTAGSLFETLSKYSLDIESIMKRDHPFSKQASLIGALIKTSGLFAYLVKERGRRTDVDSHLLACSTFLGLIEQSIETKNIFYIFLIIKVIKNNPILIDYVIETISAINDADSVLSVRSYYNNGKAANLHSRLRDLIVCLFFKHYVNILPMQLYHREVNGGVSSATVKHIRYFTNNVRPYIIEECNKYMEHIKLSYITAKDSELGYILAKESESDDDSVSGDDFSEYDS